MGTLCGNFNCSLRTISIFQIAFRRKMVFHTGIIRILEKLVLERLRLLLSKRSLLQHWKEDTTPCPPRL